jgi:hypothetical protein
LKHGTIAGIFSASPAGGFLSTFFAAKESGEGDFGKRKAEN